jgi:hypothetical protein
MINYPEMDRACFRHHHYGFMPIFFGLIMCRPVQKCKRIEHRIWFISTAVFFLIPFFTVDIIYLGIIKYRKVTSQFKFQLFWAAN